MRTESALLVIARLLALTVVSAVGGACADPPAELPPPTSVAELVDQVMTPAIGADALGDPDRCVGAVVAVVTPEGTLVRGYGATVADGATVPDGDTLFQIGSISKVFTGLELARLVVAGDVAIDAPAMSLGATDLRAATPSARFTLADLVTHHAGLPEMPPNLIDRDGDGQPDPDADPLSPGHDYARADLLAILPDLPLGGAAAYKYSNLGLGLLALMVQDHVGASSFDAVLDGHLKPALGLSATWGNVDAIPTEARSRLVQGYGLRGGQRLAGYPAEMGVLAGAGEIVTTGADMARFLAAVTGHTPTDLAAAISVALTPVAASPMADIELGYAFEVHHEATAERYTKGGGTPSFTAYLSFHRAPAVGAFVMTSCTGFQATRGLAMTIDDRLVAWTTQP